MKSATKSLHQLVKSHLNKLKVTHTTRCPGTSSLSSACKLNAPATRYVLCYVPEDTPETGAKRAWCIRQGPNNTVCRLQNYYRLICIIMDSWRVGLIWHIHNRSDPFYTFASPTRKRVIRIYNYSGYTKRGFNGRCKHLTSFTDTTLLTQHTWSIILIKFRQILKSWHHLNITNYKKSGKWNSI